MLFKRAKMRSEDIPLMIEQEESRLHGLALLQSEPRHTRHKIRRKKKTTKWHTVFQLFLQKWKCPAAVVVFLIPFRWLWWYKPGKCDGCRRAVIAPEGGLGTVVELGAVLETAHTGNRCAKRLCVCHIELLCILIIVCSRFPSSIPTETYHLLYLCLQLQ